MYFAPHNTFARLGLRWRKPRIQLISQLPDGHLVTSRAAGEWGQFVGLDDLQDHGSLDERITAHHALCHPRDVQEAKEALGTLQRSAYGGPGNF